MESNLSLFKSFREKFKYNKYFLTTKKKKYLIWQDLDSCFKDRIRTGAIINLNIKDPIEFFRKARKSFVLKVRQELKKSLLKVNVILAKFMKPSSGEEEIKHFQTKNRIIDNNTDLNLHFENHIQNNTLNKLEQFQERDSGWSLIEILQLKVNFNKYIPINVGISTTYIEIPPFIQNTKAVLNIKNNDEFCFLWCIVAALNPTLNNPCRTSSYPHFETVLKYDNIKFPIRLKDIPKFEELNKIAIDVFTIDKRKIVPLCLSQFEYLNTINLLMISCTQLEENLEEEVYNKLRINISLRFN